MYIVDGDKILFENKRQFNNIRPFEVGSHAELYKLRLDGKTYAIKLFNGLYNGQYEEDITNYQNKLKINIKSFITPKKLLYVNNKFSGYMMYFVKDRNLMDRNLDITIGEFATKAVELMRDTKELSKLKFCIYDAFLTNVMYEDGFKLIDTDPYPYDSNMLLSKTDEINSIRLNKMLLDVFSKNAYLIGSIFAYVQDRKIAVNDKQINDLFNKCDNGSISFEEFFNEVCLKAFNVADQELKRISDVGKVLKKI